MSDYIPNPPNPERDPRNYDRYDEARSGRGFTLIVGILVAVALVAGVMFFVGNRSDRIEQAQRPLDTPIERTTPAPADTAQTPSLPPPTAPRP